MMHALKDSSISKSAFDKLSPEEQNSNTKIVRGVLTKKMRPEYTRVYDSLVSRTHQEELKLRNAGRH
jgi:NADH:ubiquinone oxidoreductase subunit B-like Fe-S oxidoreductase